jgi:uncharacterized membrane protein
MDAAAIKALRRLKLTPTAAKRLFAAIRAETDAALLAALAEKAKPAAPAARENLAGEIKVMLKPLMAPMAEKAALLATAADAIDLVGKPFPKVVSALAARMGEERVRGACATVLARAKAEGDRRETVT